MKYASIFLVFIFFLAGCSHTSEKKISVYFTTTKNNANLEDCAKVAKVERIVQNGNYLEQVYLEQLLEGPTQAEKDQGFIPHILTENGLGWKNLWKDKDTVYINWPDFRQEIPNATTSCGSAAFLAPIDKTMRELPGVKYVVYAINGDPQMFYEWLQLSCPEYSNNCDKTPFDEMLGNTTL